MENIEEFSYLWTTEKERYVVEKYKDRYFIIDQIDTMMLIIEDDASYMSVVQKMIEQGNTLIDLEKNQ